jgi:hypothetical protein
MGLPHFEQSGSRNGSWMDSMHSWQNGIRFPVSRMRLQIRQGAGKTSEASASHIPLIPERIASAAFGTVRQAYIACRWEGSKIWHYS